MSINKDPQSRLILVLGPHRSGTSATTKALEAIGVELGNTLLPPDSFNPKGYFEDLDFVHLNQTLLHSLGRDWHDLTPVADDEVMKLRSSNLFHEACRLLQRKTASPKPLALKDPRCTILLNFWLTVFNACDVNPSFVVVTRNPNEAANSLSTRNGFTLEKSYWLWTLYTLESLSHTENFQRVFLDYSRLLDDPSSCLEKLAKELSLPFNKDAVQEFSSRFLAKQLNRNAFATLAADDQGSCSILAQEIYRTLSLLSRQNLRQGEDPLPKLSIWQQQLLSRENLLQSLKLHEHSLRRTEQLAAQQIEVSAQAEERNAKLRELVLRGEMEIQKLSRSLESSVRESQRITHILSSQEKGIARLTTSLAEASHKIREMESRAARDTQHIQTLTHEHQQLQKDIAHKTAVLSWVAKRENFHQRRLAQDSFSPSSRLKEVFRSRQTTTSDTVAQFFDPVWYLNKYSDIRLAGINPLEHYLRHGVFEGRSPNSDFEDLRIELEERSHQQWPAYTLLPEDYAAWANSNEIRQPMPTKARKSLLLRRPFFSVLIPVFKVKTEFLSRALKSLASQTYQRWEACIVYTSSESIENVLLLTMLARCDRRFRLKKIERNKGIADNTNISLNMARGKFIALLDHDDELAPFALSEMHRAITRDSEADFLYSDKDNIDDASTTRHSPLFKPEWSPEMLYSVNYLTHFNVIRRRLVQDVGGFRNQTDGAQDWDLFLRVCEKARKVVRVPGVHYHWRVHPESTSTGIQSKPYALEAQQTTVNDALKRQGLPADALACPDSGFSIRWRPPRNLHVHVFICAFGFESENVQELTQQVKASADLLEGLHLKQTVLKDYKRFEDSGNFSQQIRDSLAESSQNADAIVFLSAQITTLSTGWLSDLVGWVTCHPEIAFATGLTIDCEENVVEAGLIVDRFRRGSPLFRGAPLRHWGPLGGPLWYRNCSASSPWILAIKGETYFEVGGLQTGLEWEHTFVDLCTKLRKCGKRGLVEPHARAVLRRGTLPPVPAFDSSLKQDPYFHPAFDSVAPLRMSALSGEAQREHATDDTELSRVEMLPSSPVKMENEAGVLASIFDCSSDDLFAPQQHPERLGQGTGAGWCNWYIPSFENPFYGGIMTILRFADTMLRREGIRNRFIICSKADPEQMRNSIALAFPSLVHSEILVLENQQEALQTIPPSDYSIATLWTTAYVLLKVKNTALKFYFIQDFEPLFYPAGSTYAQAELTYRFGFYGITNTRPLREIYEREFLGTAIHFEPQIDPKVFFGEIEREKGYPKRLFFYGRPTHPRNSFELAAEALRKVKSSLSEKVQILSAGAEWNPAAYGLENVVENLGLLSYSQTAELYRSCHLCLVFMMTKHPSYLPFEFMACGGLLVTNANSVNRSLFQDGKNCLVVENSPTIVAERLSEAIRGYETYTNIRKRGFQSVHSRYSNWEGAFDEALRFLKNPPGAGVDRSIKITKFADRLRKDETIVQSPVFRRSGGMPLEEIAALVRSEGKLLQSPGSSFGDRLFLCLRGRRHWVPSTERLEHFGYVWPRDVEQVSEHEIRQYSSAGNVPRFWPEVVDTSQITDINLARELVCSELSGRGIEMGVESEGFPLPLACEVIYCDQRTHSERFMVQKDTFHPNDVIAPDLLTDPETLEGIADSSLNFIVSNHVLESLSNPIAAIVAAYQKLRPSGSLILISSKQSSGSETGEKFTSCETLIRTFRLQQHNPTHSRISVPHRWDEHIFRALIEWVQNNLCRWSRIWISGENVTLGEFYTVLTKPGTNQQETFSATSLHVPAQQANA